MVQHQRLIRQEQGPVHRAGRQVYMYVAVGRRQLGRSVRRHSHADGACCNLGFPLIKRARRRGKYSRASQAPDDTASHHQHAHAGKDQCHSGFGLGFGEYLAKLDGACFVDSKLLGAGLTLETARRAIGYADVVEILPFLGANYFQDRGPAGVTAAVISGAVSRGLKGKQTGLLQRDVGDSLAFRREFELFFLSIILLVRH